MFLREVKSLSGRELSEVFQRQLAVRRRVSALTGLKALKIVLLFGLEHKTAVGRGSQLLNLVSQTLDGTVRVELSLIKVEQRLHGLYVLRFGSRQSQLNGGIDFEALDFRLMGLRRCGVLSLESSDLRLERLDVAGRGLEGLKLLVALLDGIGDTIRVSLTADPVEEIYAAKDILKAVGIGGGVRIVSCPTCGRTGIDLISIAKQVEQRTRDITADIKIAVMGCVVNGPGEAREADIGIAGAKGEGIIFKKGEVIRRVPEEKLVDELMDEVGVMLGNKEKL